MSTLLPTFILVIICSIVSGQTWPKIFGIEEHAWSRDVIEYYDKGYIVLGQVDPGFAGVNQTFGWIIKTDINGNQLWEKKIYNENYSNFSSNLNLSTDAGIILIGSTTKLDSNNTDIMFIKLDACGNREWCTLLSTPGCSDYGIKILPIEDGYISLLSYYNEDITHKRVWTLKLDLSGNVIWSKAYLYEPEYWSEQSSDLMLTEDGGFLITAYGWYDPAGGLNGKLRSILIKTDNEGEEQWITRWGELSDYISLMPMYPTMDDQGYYYCTSTHYRKLPVEGYVPAFIKTAPNGQEQKAVDLMAGTEAGIASTLHFLYPDTLLLACGWKYPLLDYSEGVIKCDTAGNNIKVKILIDSVINTFEGSAITFDKKMVLAGGFTKLNITSDIYLFKINSNLDLDSAYTAPRTYDSLCPHPIVSDTFDLEGCGIYTSLKDPVKEPEYFKLKAWPVPAIEMFKVQIPDQLSAESSMNGVHINIVYHQWDKTTLQIMDITGKLIFTKEVYFNDKEVEINCSGWPAGFYAARLAYKNMKVGEVKVMVVK
jgi:hypothetical protein